MEEKVIDFKQFEMEKSQKRNCVEIKMTREGLCSKGLSYIKDKELLICLYKKQDKPFHEKIMNEIFVDESPVSVTTVKEQEWNEILHDNDKLFLKVIEMQTEEFIGEISLRNLETETPELGIYILPQYRNKKIGTRVVKCFAENLQKLALYDYLSVRIYSDNLESQRLFENLGAIKIGEEGKSYCTLMKKTMQDMGRERFEQVIGNTYESTQRYVLCYKFDLNNVTLIGN